MHYVYFLADVNECLDETTVHKCSSNANCVNTEGSYVCECPPGYMLLADQRTCDGKLLFRDLYGGAGMGHGPRGAYTI